MAQELAARLDTAAFQTPTPWSVERMYLDDSIHIVQRTPGAGNLCIGPFGSTEEAQAKADRMNSIAIA